jgi:hypothetical protein
MRVFFKFTAFYACIAVIIVFLFRENAYEVLIGAHLEALYLIRSLGYYSFWLAPFSLLGTLLVGRRWFRGHLEAVLLAAIGIVFLQFSFSLVKKSIPYMVPFYADPFLAELDRLIHGGADPWVWIYSWQNWVPLDELVISYFVLWAPLAIGFPILLALLETDQDRLLRYAIIYIFSWVFIGNFLALIGSSVGPVYYDRLFATDRFLELNEMLDVHFPSGTFLGDLQRWLWESYAENLQVFGSGISAFPSVHVSTSFVVVLYAIERSRYLILPACIFLLSIFILSIFTGFHYAVDGYASLIIIAIFWFILTCHAGKGASSCDRQD